MTEFQILLQRANENIVTNECATRPRFTIVIKINWSINLWGWRECKSGKTLFRQTIWEMKIWCFM